MASAAKRKQGFILALFVIAGLAAAFMMFRPIPAPVSKHTIELDTANAFK